MSGQVRTIYTCSTLITGLDVWLRRELDISEYRNRFKVVGFKVNGFYGNVSLTPETEALIPDIEILLADADITGHIFSHPHSRLQWSQATNVGMDLFFVHLRKNNIQKRPDFILTRRGDVFPKFMAEFVLARMLFRERFLGKIHDHQKARVFPWFPER